MFCWHLRAMQPDPSPSSTSTSQRQILGVTTLSLIYLSKSFHQENNYFEISTVYSPHEFYFLFFYSQTQSFLLFPNYHFCSVICLQMTSFCYSFVYSNLIVGTVSNQYAPCFVWAFFPPVGRAVGKERRSRCLGKSPKCIQTETAVIENMHSQLFAFSILPFKRRAIFCYAICLGSFHSLSCIASYLTSFSFSHRSVAVLIQWSSRTLYNTPCCLPASLCVIIIR